jgi:hypothetical protein
LFAGWAKSFLDRNASGRTPMLGKWIFGVLLVVGAVLWLVESLRLAGRCLDAKRGLGGRFLITQTST